MQKSLGFFLADRRHPEKANKLNSTSRGVFGMSLAPLFVVVVELYVVVLKNNNRADPPASNQERR
jgi:hypothetical protein